MGGQKEEIPHIQESQNATHYGFNYFFSNLLNQLLKICVRHDMKWCGGHVGNDNIMSIFLLIFPFDESGKDCQLILDVWGGIL